MYEVCTQVSLHGEFTAKIHMYARYGGPRYGDLLVSGKVLTRPLGVAPSAPPGFSP